MDSVLQLDKADEGEQPNPLRSPSATMRSWDIAGEDEQLCTSRPAPEIPMIPPDHWHTPPSLQLDKADEDEQFNTKFDLVGWLDQANEQFLALLGGAFALLCLGVAGAAGLSGPFACCILRARPPEAPRLLCGASPVQGANL